jgi:hypothetical protein
MGDLFIHDGAFDRPGGLLTVVEATGKMSPEGGLQAGVPTPGQVSLTDGKT